MFIAGIDVGASYTKAVLIDFSKKIIAFHVHKSGSDIINSSQAAYAESLRSAGIDKKEVSLVVATGFGRYNIAFANQTITEISAHARGVYHYFPRPVTVIDIGGQDNKIIRLDEKGNIANFKMNRKCAAGTGAFIEDIAYKMDLPLSDLNKLAKKATEDLVLGSYCIVFTATEILTKIREGKSKENIIRGVFSSVAKRIVELDPLESELVMTGGVIAYNDILIEIMGKMIGKKISIPPDPQLIGAYGAALFGLNGLNK
jgi:predicted CoA-substrate-specific enzyme activase